MKETLARRYFYKLGANILTVPVYLLMEAILPRALGPALYGNYNFATSLFQQFTGFLDMGTATCFYNLLSRFQKRASLVSFYFRIEIIVFLLLALCAALFLVPSIGHKFMPDVPLYFAPLAAIWAFLTWISRVLRLANDALGATVPSELWRAGLSVLGALALLALFLSGYLNIGALFMQQYLLLGFCSLAWWHIAKSALLSAGAEIKWKMRPRIFHAYEARFFNYSHPLFIHALLSFFMLAGERWLLQWFDGSAQQGFFALSQKVSMACFLFVSAMTPLLMREFSIAWGKRDLGSIASTLSRFAPMLYVLAAYFSCFTVAEGKILVNWFGGSGFSGAILPVQIMALYPVHQTYGQIATAIFHAAGKTGLIRNLTAVECAYGFILVWFCVAPNNLGGLNLGATGLAVKTVIAQFISVNLYLWMASGLLGFSFLKSLLQQIVVVALFLGFAFFSSWLGDLFFERDIFSFLTSGFIYTCVCIGSCVFNPHLMGLNRNDLAPLFLRVSGRVNKTF